MKHVADQFRLEFMNPPANPKPAKFFQVGGSVRDKYLGIPAKDIDYAVETESFDSMRDAILARGGKIFLETPQYFTIRAHVPNLGATDYVLCRKDGIYKDGRHPESVTVGTIADDLARRDFTCNAIAIDTDTLEVLDPYNGINDATSGILRAVRDAKERLNEDKLRAFRALRFYITKEFDLDSELRNAILDLQDFSGVSTERIREELNKMFKYNSRKSMMELTLQFPNLARVVFERGIWFKPTTEK